jgi:hypothetical protein
MHCFCTYFDQVYLSRGLALYESLKQHCSSFELWILCMDNESYQMLAKMDLAHARLISLSELEDKFPQLRQAKANRSRIEYYFTCTSALSLYVLDANKGVDAVTYLDADLFFFANPAPVFEEIGNHSVAIIGHRFPPELQDRRQYGIYNVGFLFFKRDAVGLACLGRWFEQCLDWCYDRLEATRFADQKYLDDWPERFENVVVLQYKGANLAPWNLANYKITRRNKHVLIDDERLIFFHFHALKRLGNWLFEPHLFRYNVTPSRVVLKHIYKPYIRTLMKIERQLESFGPRPPAKDIRSLTEPASVAQEPPPSKAGRLTGQVRWILDTCRKIYERRYILVLGRRSI